MNKFKKWFSDCKFALVAFSGGVDSCLVTYLTLKYLGKQKMLAVLADSPSLKRADFAEANNFCKKHDIPLRIIKTPEMESKAFYTNPINRCYTCKVTLYNQLLEVSEKYPGAWILNGQNVDDYEDYRPGIKAGIEYAVRSPLVELNFNKTEVRAIAKRFHLECWNKPASPCLSSRVPYGEIITATKLKMIEKSEEILANYGFKETRVRHYNSLARIEVPTRQIGKLKANWTVVKPKLLATGFERCEIDEEGLVSGKLNRVIK